MRRPSTPEVRLFAHYSIPRPETYAKVGHFVCGSPLHVTFAGIMTRQPLAVIERLRDVLTEPMAFPHMERDEITLAYGHYRTKPIVKLHDTAQRLIKLQERVFNVISPMNSTYITPRSRYINGRTPHVTINQIMCHPQLPESFDIDHIIVTSGTKAGPSHWHNHVWDIIYLNQAEQAATT